MQFYKSIFPNETILHIACESGNFELVDYLISLDKIDISSTTVVILVFNKILKEFLIQFLIIIINKVYKSK